jgi:hypothetical protein
MERINSGGHPSPFECRNQNEYASTIKISVDNDRTTGGNGD